MISAHRGASSLAPENTLLSFFKAMEMGADFIEMDIRTTRDGAQVIVHDASLKRTAGLNKKTSRTNLKKIKKLSAGSWFEKQYSDQKVPTLEEVCELVVNENKNRSVPVKLYMDCKAIKPDEVVRILNTYHLLDSAVFYGNLNTLEAIKKFHGKARLMPAYPGIEEMKTMVLTLAPYAVDISSIQLNAENVSFCHANGIKVFVDLLDQNDVPEWYRKAIQLKVDLIQTDKILSVLQTFQEFKK